MTKIKLFVVTSAAAFVFAACAGNTPQSDADAGKKAAEAAPTNPTMAELLTLEKRAYEAWQSKDTEFWDTFLSDKFVGYGSSGRLDKASAKREYSGTNCDIKSYAVSDEQMTMLDDDVALLTYKTTIDGTCDGQKVPVNSRAAGIYVREDETWKGAFHAEVPIVDPASLPAKPVANDDAPEPREVKPDTQDADTDALMQVEKAVWEAWKDNDAKKLEDLTANDISFVNIYGTYFPTKSDVIKDWTGPGCEVQSVSVTDGESTMLSPTVGILTHKGTADGTCFGQKVGSVWGTSVYIKEGDIWKWAFGINLPARTLA